MNDQLHAALAAGATALTPTNLLAHELRKEFDAHQSLHGCEAWRSGDVLTFDGWTTRVWSDAMFEGRLGEPARDAYPILLSPVQERMLWERIIAENVSTLPLLIIHQAARDAANAYTMLHDWAIPIDEGYGTYEEARRFLGWMKRFEDVLRRKALTVPALVRERVLSLIADPATPLPETVLLAGYGARRPRIVDVFRHALESRGTRVLFADPDVECLSTTLYEFPTAEDELHAAAAYTRSVLEREPVARIGVIVDDLGEVRSIIERLFSDIIQPADNLEHYDGFSGAFHISLGVPLVDVPLVRTALDLLRLLTGRVHIETFSRILRSRYVGGARQARHTRALFDVFIRDHAVSATLAPDDIARFSEAYLHRVKRADSDTAPLQTVQNLFGTSRGVSAALEVPSAWAERFRAALTESRWCGDARLDSREQQALQRWEEVLSHFASLDLVRDDRLTVGDALGMLERMTVETVFEPKAGAPQIHILGSEAAAGMHFDHMWIANMSSVAWPQPARPNPFIPIGLQARAGIPSATAALSAADAQAKQTALLRSARNVVASYHALDGDTELLPSPLWKMAPIRPPASTVPSYAEILQNARATNGQESFVDESGPGLGASMRGGTKIFTLQAACPFKAYAQLRLDAKEIQHAQVGISPKDKGTIVHAALAAFWSGVRTHQALAAMNDTAVREHVRASVAAAVAEYVSTVQCRDLQFLYVERDRIERLLVDWLMRAELPRPPFRVRDIEKDCEIVIGPLSVRVRIDRIDELSDGRLLLIDYKTGITTIRNWLGERPLDPQLPVYVTGMDESIAGIAFAQLKRERGELQFAGVASGDIGIPGIHALPRERHEPKVEWVELTRIWDQALQHLAGEYLAGVARVDPAEGGITCRACGFAVLCRIAETVLTDTTEESENGE